MRAWGAYRHARSSNNYGVWATDKYHLSGDEGLLAPRLVAGSQTRVSWPDIVVRSDVARSQISVLQHYILFNQLSCTPRQLAFFLAEYRREWFYRDGMFIDPQTGSPVDYNLWIYVYQCPSCAWRHCLQHTPQMRNYLFKISEAYVQQSAQKFWALEQNSCGSWLQFQRAAKKLAKKLVQDHANCQHVKARDVQEFVAEQSTRYCPIGPRYRPPFLGSLCWARCCNLAVAVGWQNVVTFLETTLPDNVCTEAASDWLKYMAAMAKASVGQFPEAGCLIDLNRWRGHCAPMSGDELLRAGREWLCEEHSPTAIGSYEWSCLCFAKIGHIVASNISPCGPAIDITHDIIYQRTWGTAGSSDRYDRNIYVRGRLTKLLKTKNSMALSLTVAEISEAIGKVCRERISVCPKADELGKARHILRSGDAKYLLDSYIDFQLLRRPRRWVTEPTSPIFLGQDQWYYHSRAAGQRVAAGDLSVQFDHSKFDEHQSYTMVKSVSALLVDLVSRGPSPTSDPLVVQCAYESLALSAIVYCCDGQFVGKHRGGMPSGWKWTALGDTLLNMAMTIVAWELWAPGVPLKWASMQGDDSLVFVDPKFRGCVFQVAAGLEFIGYELNPAKNYISTTVADFIGHSYLGPNNIGGAASRSLSTIVVRHPFTREFLAPHELVVGMIWNWAMLLKRMERVGKTADVWNMVRKDVWGASRLSADDVLAHMVSPKSLGGLGMVGLDLLFGHKVDVGKTMILLPAPQEPKVDNVSLPVGVAEVVLTRPLVFAAFQVYLRSIHMLQTAKREVKFVISLPPKYAYVSGYHKAFSIMPFAEWKRFAPGPIQPYLQNELTRDKGCLLNPEFLELVSPATAAIAKNLINRKATWAVVKSWLTNRIPVRRRFVFTEDELAMSNPETSNRRDAMCFLHARNLTMNRWREMVESLPLLPRGDESANVNKIMKIMDWWPIGSVERWSAGGLAIFT